MRERDAHAHCKKKSLVKKDAWIKYMEQNKDAQK